MVPHEKLDCSIMFDDACWHWAPWQFPNAVRQKSIYKWCLPQITNWQNKYAFQYDAYHLLVDRIPSYRGGARACLPGGYLPGGVCLRWVSARGGCLPHCMLGYTHPLWTEWQTGIKTLPSFAGGNYKKTIISQCIRSSFLWGSVSQFLLKWN